MFRPDQDEPPRQPPIRRGLPADRDNPGQPALASPAPQTSSFQPSKQDRDQAIDLTLSARTMGVDGLLAASAVACAGALLRFVKRRNLLAGVLIAGTVISVFVTESVMSLDHLVAIGIGVAVTTPRSRRRLVN